MSERAQRRRAGFSLIEVMVASGILAVGLLGLMAMQIRAHKDHSSVRGMTQAISIGNQLMDQIQRMGWAVEDAYTGANCNNWEIPEWVEYDEEPGQVALEIRVPKGTGTSISNNQTLVEKVFQVRYRVCDGPSDFIRQVDVNVFWHDHHGFATDEDAADDAGFENEENVRQLHFTGYKYRRGV